MYGAKRSPLSGFDFPLFLAALLISLLGLAMASSAVRNTPGMEGAVQRQAIYLAVGVLLALLLAALDYRLIVSSALIWYGLGIASLLVVLIVGATIHGGQRWLNIGSQQLQPSEFMKLALIVTLAQYLGARDKGPWRFRYLVVSGLIAAVPIGLVYSQPDLGTALAFVVIWGLLVYVSGISVREIVLIVGIVVVAFPLIWSKLEPYMRERVLSFINPGSNPESSYIMDQALISIGSGAIWGKGYASGSQSQLHFLRVRHSDFIFSVIGEELGFIGAVTTIVLLAFICYRLLSIGRTAEDGFGRVIACGVGGFIAFQALVNIGMNVGWLPVTGLPLPFISLGGSALIAQFLGIGLAESVAWRRRFRRT